jgi:proline iminopeptidase
MKTLSILLTIFLALQINAAPQMMDSLYVNTFGDHTNQPLIFVHGGPGSNSHDFEVTTAQKLADEGYYVIVYDQRGQGRSHEATDSAFTYKIYSDDLKMIIDRLGLSSPILLGYSHGGPISINFDQSYPNVAKSILLISAPINFWGSMKSIYENCSRNYTASNNTEGRDHLAALYYELFINDNSEYSQDFLVGSTFIHGMQCGLYDTSYPTPQALELKSLVQQKPIQQPLSGMTTAMPSFLKNENYIQGNYFSFVLGQKGRYFGIYGDEDGLFTPLELSLIQSALNSQGETPRFKLVKGSSHSVFIDQQPEFIRLVKEFTK